MVRPTRPPPRHPHADTQELMSRYLQSFAQYSTYAIITCSPLSVANAHGCRDRPHTNRARCCRTTKEPLSERKTNTQWSVPDPLFLVHEACVLVGRRGETFLAGERDDNPRPLSAFCIVWKDQWGGEGPPAVLVLSASCHSSFFCQAGEGGVLLQQTEPGQLATTHHLCPAPVYIVSQPATPPSGSSDVSIRSLWLMDVAMSPLDCVLAIISSIAPTYWECTQSWRV